MSEYDITSAQYIQDVEGNNSVIQATIDDTTWDVPMKAGNSHYDEIMRQVAAGTLTIQEAD